MSAVVGQDWRPKTYRELFIQYQSVLMETWSHTASIKGLFAKENTPYHQLHPYYKKGSSGQVTKVPLKTSPVFSINKDMLSDTL